jgi:hypothetical protein
MSTSRLLRKRLSISLIGVMLLMQWLVLAHACAPAVPAAPAQATEHAACAGHGAAATEAATTEPASDMALCKAHCTEDQSLPAAQADGSLPAPTLGWFIVAQPVLTAWLPLPLAQAAAPASGAPPPGWPPLYLSQQVLRN